MNKINVVSTKNAPVAVGPYSQAIVVNNFVFCAGQIGIDPKSGELVDGIKKQTVQVLKNIQAVLQSAGSSLNKVVKTTIYLQDMADYVLVNQIYGEYFKEHKPARSTVAVASLPKGALIEIETVAVL